MFCHAFATGEITRNQTNYQANGVDGYFVTVAQRWVLLNKEGKTSDLEVKQLECC